ncbi:MAG TPA: ABC transporter permease [Vicinamibacterales bacterium]|nr:ABC transporter permease [Vicinamibacterales bacterium]
MLYSLIALCYRITAVWRRRRVHRDLEDELAFHLAMREADIAARTDGELDARRAAMRRFGNRTRVKEELTDMWTFPTIESVWQDVRYAFRTLRRTPTFALVAITTLALGIGGTTAIFSLGEAASVDALPYREPERLVQLWGTVERERTERRGASYPDFVDWRRQSSSFDGMALFDGATATLALQQAERIDIEIVSANYFQILGVTPALGRPFQQQEDARGADGVAILSDGLWRRSFGADASIVGSKVVLATGPVTVVGVMPPGFRGLTDQAQLWLPFEAVQSPQTLDRRGTRGFVAIARLKSGVTQEGAQRELDTISARLEQTYPDTNEKRAVEVSPLAVEVFGQLRPALRVLLAAVVVVLLIACANVANLLLARAATRQREIAVRSAIGASRSRLMRQLLTESLVLTLLGAGAGLAVAHGTLRVLLATSPVVLPSFTHPAVDLPAVGFAVVLAAACGILLGLAPAAHARVARLSDALKSTTRGTATGARSARSILVIAEVSLALVLLVSASLLIRSVSNLTAIDPGFEPESVLTLRVSLPAEQATPAGELSGPIGNERVLERLRSLPGVVAASLTTDLPLDGSSSAVFYAADGMGEVTAQNRPRAYVHRVTPDFFATLRIPLLAGRTFAPNEIVPDTPAVIVTERLVRRFWPHQNPIGKRIKLGDLQSEGPWRQIIGVIPDVKYRGLPENPTADPDLFFPMLAAVRQVAIVVRTSLPPSSIAGTLRAAVQELNPAIPVYNVTTLEELVAAQTAQSHFTMWLMGTFAALAVLLSALGIFGVMSYLVTQRTREIGIRLALGASHRMVVREVAADGARLVAVGVVLGIAGAIAARQVLAAQLFAVGAIDTAQVFAVAVIVTVALVACVIPAVRASRVDPMLAVRAE